MDGGRVAAALPAALSADLVESAGRLFAAARVVDLAARLADVLERFHAEHPLETGMPAQSWRAAAGSAPESLVDLAERRLTAEGRLERDGSQVRRARWAPKLGGETARLREELLETLRLADAEPPSIAELAARHPGADVPGLLRLMAREGVVVAVGKERCYESAALAEECDRVVTILTELGSASPAAIRDRLGRSRKWLIPLLEWCDTQGITLRQGDVRVLGSAPRA
jgi:selenocysteine-specific elongation factor